MLSTLASRLPGETNPLYLLKNDLEREARKILDLTSGNVTEHGILFPQPVLEEILLSASRRARIYRPDSFGARPAREAIASYYRRAGVTIGAEDILLTPGTSISYWYCFKLLADEGDEMLCPRPSYPLFDYIAALSGVRLVPYDLEEDRHWELDPERIENSISTRTRALVLISPHNPTGRTVSMEEIEQIANIACRHDLAIISDEVFSEFLFRSGPLPRPAGCGAPLVFTLNGFSKMFALPGIKLGWAAVTGERGKVRQAMRALELISDTFLPVNEIVQAATPEIFDRGADFLRWYAEQIRERRNLTVDFLSQCRDCSFHEPEGGFYVTVRLLGIDEERAAKSILTRGGILVHPGYFYDMVPDHLVFTFVEEPEVLRGAFPRLLEALESARETH